MCVQRSKTKRHFRAVKRSDAASAYKLAEDIRVQRLSAQLKQSALKPRALTDKEEWERKQAGFETDDDDDEEEDAGQGEAEGATKKEGESTVAPFLPCGAPVASTKEASRVGERKGVLSRSVAIRPLIQGGSPVRPAFSSCVACRDGSRTGTDRVDFCCRRRRRGADQDLDFGAAHVPQGGVPVQQGLHRQADPQDSLYRPGRE